MSNCPVLLYSCFIYTLTLYIYDYIYLFTLLTMQYICNVQLIFIDQWSAVGLKKADQNEWDESDDSKLNHLIYYLAFFLCLIVLFWSKSFAALLVFGNFQFLTPGYVLFIPISVLRGKPAGLCCGSVANSSVAIVCPERWLDDGGTYFA